MNDQQLVDVFQDYLVNERHYSNLTKKAYMEDIQSFRTFLEDTGNPALKRVSLQDARIYLGHLTDHQYSRNSISRKISSLRAFYQFLLKNEEIEDNPFSYLNLKRKGFRLPSFFYSEEMEQLFEAVHGDKPLDYRNEAILEVLYGTGIRVSECTGIRLSDIDFEMSILLVRGKGNKERYVPFGHYAAASLEEYLEKGRIPLMKHHEKDHDFLFINHEETQLLQEESSIY